MYIFKKTFIFNNIHFSKTPYILIEDIMISNTYLRRT